MSSHGFRQLLNDAAIAVIALCTLLVTVMVVRREMLGAADQPANPGGPPVLVDEWEDVAARGHRLGPDDARLTIVTFSDFECPACQYFAREAFPGLQERYPGEIALVYRHWPLSKHKFAYPAAIAAECAAIQGRFWEFHDAVFRQQQLLGVKSFVDLAAETGVADLAKFESCTKDSTVMAIIDQDIEEINKLGGRGTPTLIVNGWLLTGGSTQLDSVAASLLQTDPG